MILRIILSIHLLAFSIKVNGQNGNCQKLIVGVYFTGIEEELLPILNEKYGSKSRMEWIDEIDSKVLKILRDNSPEIEFFSSLKDQSKDPDYLFVYHLAVIAIDTEVIIPADSISYIDPMTNWHVTEYLDPIYDSEPGFWVLSRLVVNSPCYPNLRWILEVELSKNLDLDQAIHENLMSYYRMINIIDEHERKKSAPAREPEMEIKLEKEYLSPLDKETRQMELYVKVKDCHGRYVYYPSSSNQPVYYQKNTDRCEYKAATGCHRLFDYEGFATVLIGPEYRAIGEYHLKKGIDPAIETVTLKTCGISDRANRTEVKNIIIRGLEVMVKPVRKVIYFDEQTEIILSFNEVDPGGEKEPISGKELKVKIEGLVNGEISPKSNFVTDYKGEVRINYQAGDMDDQITIIASYQPPDYPDKAVGKGSIIVKPPEYDATVTLKKILFTQMFTSSIEDQYHKPCQVHSENRYSLEETIEASLYVVLKMEYSEIMPLFNQRWEYYKPIAANISNFAIYHNEERYAYGNSTGNECASGGFETIVRTEQDITKQKISEPLVGYWIIAYDKETNKAVKLLPAGYSIDYDFNVTDLLHSRQWDDKGEKEDNNKSQKTSQFHNFEVGPVEDPKPDPTYKPHLQGIYDYIRETVGDSIFAEIPVLPISPQGSEEIPEINPDILVQFGDGKRYFGGRGYKVMNKEIDNGFEKQEESYIWQVARKRKE